MRTEPGTEPETETETAIASNREALQAILEKKPSLKEHASDIVARALPAIVITPARRKTGKAQREQSASARPSPSTLGASRMGGAPDLPKGTPWPRFTASAAELEERYIAESVASVLDGAALIDVPFAFIAQVRLDDLAEHDIDHKLPKSGLLSFFLRPDLMFEQRVDDRDVKRVGRDWRYHLPCAVIHSSHDDRETVATTTTPAELASWVAPPLAIRSFSTAMVLPVYDQLDIDLDRGSKAYIELTIAQMDLPEYQLLTFPTGTHDVDVPPADGHVLLSTRLPDVMFDGAFSCAYFCIADDALREQAFDHAYVRISSE